MSLIVQLFLVVSSLGMSQSLNVDYPYRLQTISAKTELFITGHRLYCLCKKTILVLTFWLWFCCYPRIGMKIIVYISSPGIGVFFMFTVWFELFSLVLTFPWLRIEALLLSTVHGIKLVKAENQETQFPLLCTKSFHLSKDESSEVNLSAIRAQHIVLVWPIYWPSVGCGTIVESSGPICRPSMPSKKFFKADLSTNRSQRVSLIRTRLLGGV